MPSIARIIPESPPAVAPVPVWARGHREHPCAYDAVFAAGAALAALHPVARDEHLLGQLWRQRLALGCAATLMQQQGRTEDAMALRDAHYLTRAGDDPGPAGRILRTWRALGAQTGKSADHWLNVYAITMDCGRTPGCDEIFQRAGEIANGEGAPILAAADIAATSMKLAPNDELLALWLADVVLAQRLRWPCPVPLLASLLPRTALRRAARHLDGDTSFMTGCCVAYAGAATAATDLYADLGRRANRLLSIAPKLRSREASATVARLMTEDAQAAEGGRTVSDRSSRRLFERLVTLGVVQELTGRPTFRLYGL